MNLKPNIKVKNQKIKEIHKKMIVMSMKFWTMSNLMKKLIVNRKYILIYKN